MKLKNSQLNPDAVAALNAIMDMELSVALAWKLKKTIQVLEPIVKNIGDMRQKIVQEFAEKDDDGKVITPIGEDGKEMQGQVTIKNIQGFNEKVQELLDIENDVEVTQIPLNELEGKIKPKNLLLLDFLIKE